MVNKKKNSLFVLGWDRKIHPSGSAFVITWQASRHQTVILRTDFSIPPSEHRKTIRIYHECEGGIEKSVPRIID